MSRLPWSTLDDDAVTACRALAMDAVQKVGNGHPGTAMALAPVAYTLFQRFLRHDPSDPTWLGRDRFVLSCGHSSLTLYIQLFLSGYGLTLKDLEEFRTHNSLTPGHPEYGHTRGVETTTGPLGAGIANAVGMAMAARYEKGLLDPESETTLFDHNIWVICSDGDLQEGVSAEASSLAGTQALGNLKIIYDDNRISIEGDTHVAFTEDVGARYRAYGWNVIDVAHLGDGNIDRTALDLAMEAAENENRLPTLIRLKTVIAWPAPHARGTSKSHGSALGAEEVAATKLELGLNPDLNFQISDEVLRHAREVGARGNQLHKDWDLQFSAWSKAHPDRAALLERLRSHTLPDNWADSLPNFPVDKEIATRSASGKVINAIAAVLPEFWGGSADLADSNNTTIEGAGSFLPITSEISGADPFGRVIHFGIREHAMGGILNGIALHGLSKPFGGTFLVFSDYMRGAVRLAALMNLPVTFVWTHDSIGLGEDGPTHQPVEHLAALRAIPNLSLIRPADANETTAVWKKIIEDRKPVGLALSRQNLPVIDRSMYETIGGATQGAYVVKSAGESVDALIIATGSELHVALAAAKILENEGKKISVISAPCLEWFQAQSAEYRNSILPQSVRARVSVEAGVSQGWREYVGDCGEIVALDHFGASASASILFAEFGFSPENVAAATRRSIIKATEH